MPCSRKSQSNRAGRITVFRATGVAAGDSRRGSEAREPGSALALGRHARRKWRQRKNFVELAVNEFDRDLDAGQSMLAGKINGSLRMLKIQRLLRICGPVPQTAQVQPRAAVLQENFHVKTWSGLVSSRFNAGAARGSAQKPEQR